MYFQVDKFITQRMDLSEINEAFRWGVVKGTFGTFGTAKSLALAEILG